MRMSFSHSGTPYIDIGESNVVTQLDTGGHHDTQSNIKKRLYGHVIVDRHVHHACALAERRQLL